MCSLDSQPRLRCCQAHTPKHHDRACLTATATSTTTITMTSTTRSTTMTAATTTTTMQPTTTMQLIWLELRLRQPTMLLVLLLPVFFVLALLCFSYYDDDGYCDYDNDDYCTLPAAAATATKYRHPIRSQCWCQCQHLGMSRSRIWKSSFAPCGTTRNKMCSCPRHCMSYPPKSLLDHPLRQEFSSVQAWLSGFHMWTLSSGF